MYYLCKNIQLMMKDYNKKYTIMTRLKNFGKTVMTIAIICLGGLLLTNCNSDIRESRTLSGEWQGYWGMYYEYEYRGRIYVFDSYASDVVFYPNHEYATYGDGYQVDWYRTGPYSRISLHFLWEIRNGRIFMSYPGNHMYDAEIYDYFLNDYEFYGFFGNSNERFDMIKLVSYNWTPYYQYDYHYWTYDSWSWNGYNGYYYTRSAETENQYDTQGSNLSTEDNKSGGRLIRIGCHKAEGKTTKGKGAE